VLTVRSMAQNRSQEVPQGATSKVSKPDRVLPGDGKDLEGAMTRRYESYLVRCWRWTDGSQRMVIEHVQSGSRTVVASPSDAVAWISDQATTVADGCAARMSGRGEDALREKAS
jgi:hypothetical protein